MWDSRNRALPSLAELHMPQVTKGASWELSKLPWSQALVLPQLWVQAWCSCTNPCVGVWVQAWCSCTNPCVGVWV